MATQSEILICASCILFAWSYFQIQLLVSESIYSLACADSTRLLKVLQFEYFGGVVPSALLKSIYLYITIHDIERKINASNSKITRITSTGGGTCDAASYRHTWTPHASRVSFMLQKLLRDIVL